MPHRFHWLRAVFVSQAVPAYLRAAIAGSLVGGGPKTFTKIGK